MDAKVKRKNIIEIMEINNRLTHVHDIDSMLDRILYEVRKITDSEAGTIFLVEGNQLSFEYVQNDALIRDHKSQIRYVYTKQKMPIDNHSIAGYVALNKKPLVIDDVYLIPPDIPCSFNRSFDESSSYRTKSVLTVPLITSREKVIGVIQVINSRSDSGKVIPYSKYDESLVSLFANQAANSIEKARITREIILRMIKIAELRDPLETGGHVNRVGAYSIEIYHSWAAKKGMMEKEIKWKKDTLRIASMLHDVGKVAISDTILKKCDRLDENEYDSMKLHTVYGARLFKDSQSEWDDMAAEIALNHHEKWDGSGYPGHLNNIYADDICFKPGKKGQEIPLMARIVSLADVYDALISNRSYKNSWEESKVLDYIVHQKNKHFDPEIVDAFMDIYDVIKSVKEKYSSS